MNKTKYTYALEIAKQELATGKISYISAETYAQRLCNRYSKKEIIALHTSTIVKEEVKKVEITEEEMPTFEASSLEGYIYPKSDPTFILSTATKTLFSSILKLAKEKHPPHVLMIGPQGCGKTETAREFAARVGLPLLKINCSLVREPRDWFGSKTAKGGDVMWIKSQFAEAVSQGGVVILLDEITRCAPSILNSLLPLLDATRQTFIEEVKDTLTVGPNVFFFATANVGGKFTGTFGKMDSALSDRFSIRIPVTYLDATSEIDLLVNRTKIEKKAAEKLVNVARQVRAENELGGKLTETISTRNLLDAATLYNIMGKTAFDFTLVPLFSPNGGRDSEQAQVLQMIQGQFGA